MTSFARRGNQNPFKPEKGPQHRTKILWGQDGVEVTEDEGVKSGVRGLLDLGTEPRVPDGEGLWNTD